MRTMHLGDGKKQVHIRMFIHSIILCNFSYFHLKQNESHTIAIKTRAGNKCIKVILLRFSWKSQHYCCPFPGTLKYEWCETKRKELYPQTDHLYTHNRIRESHSKIFYKQYLDLFLPIADIPDSFGINTAILRWVCMDTQCTTESSHWFHV